MNIDKSSAPGCLPATLETSLTDGHASSCTSALFHGSTAPYIASWATCQSEARVYACVCVCVCVCAGRRKNEEIHQAQQFASLVCFFFFSTRPLIPLSSHSLLHLYIFSHLISRTGNKFHVLRATRKFIYLSISLLEQDHTPLLGQ